MNNKKKNEWVRFFSLDQGENLGMRLPNTSAVDYLALSKLNCKILIPIEALSYIINHNSHMEGNCYITTQVVKVAIF